MADLSIRNLASIERELPDVGRALRDLQNSHNYVARQTNAAPVGQTPAPLVPTSIKATGGAGIVHITLGDSSQAYRGNEYHMEIMPQGGNWATDAHPISTGPARAFRGALGAGKYVARACTGYSTSNPSSWIYSEEIDATGATPPAFHTNPGSGVGGGGAYGNVPFSGPTPPKRS